MTILQNTSQIRSNSSHNAKTASATLSIIKRSYSISRTNSKNIKEAILQKNKKPLKISGYQIMKINFREEKPNKNLLKAILQKNLLNIKLELKPNLHFGGVLKL